MNDSLLTRRALLKRSGAATFAAGLTATIGCTESLPPLGQRIQYGRVDVPAATRPPGRPGPTYRQWIPAASALPGDTLDPGFINYTTPSDLGGDVIGFDNREPHFFQKPYLDHLGVDYDDFSQVIGLHDIDTTYIITGSFESSTVGETLINSGYTEEGVYSEHTLYDRDDTPRTAAVTNDTIVWARHEQGRAIVEAVIDASNGDVDRHHEVSDDFAMATDAVGSRPWIFADDLGVDPTGEAAFTSLSYTFDADHIYYIHHTLYPEGAAVTEQDIKDALTSNSNGLRAWAVDIQLDGRLSTIEMGIAPENRPKQYTGVTVPVITWGVDDFGDELTIRHENGDSTSAASITIYDRSGSDRTALDTQFADSYDTIAPGDSITVETPMDATDLVGEFSPPDMPRAAQFPLYTL